MASVRQGDAAGQARLASIRRPTRQMVSGVRQQRTLRNVGWNKAMPTAAVTVQTSEHFALLILEFQNKPVAYSAVH